MIVGCYTLDLYCDTEVPEEDFRHLGGVERYGFAQFTGETAGECRRQAREAGWKIDLRNGTATCPTHARGERSPEGGES